MLCPDCHFPILQFNPPDGLIRIAYCSHCKRSFQVALTELKRAKKKTTQE